jgi:hypothetical protein
MSTQQVQFQCYRLDFSSNCVEELEEFSRIHRYDDRKIFKEAWTQWIQQKNIQNMIDEEYSFAQNTQILDQSLSKKTLLDKMFNSVRYYHRKKWLQNTKDSVDTYEDPLDTLRKSQKPQKQKGFSKEFLAMIDKSIQDQIQEQTNRQNTQPHKHKQHDHIIMTDSGEVIEFCDPRIQLIKKTIEEIFDIEIHNHSLYLYGNKKVIKNE